MEGKSVLFVYRVMRTWANRDLDTLKKKFNVTTIHATKKILKTFINILKLTRKVDFVFVWFAGWHAILSLFAVKILKKKIIVVVGGYDVAYDPKIGYGAIGWRRVITKYILENSDKILPFSEFALDRTLDITKINKSNFEVVPLACDAKKFRPNGKKENIILTVGFVSHTNIKRKGFETFVKSARYLPNLRFVLAGGHLEKDAVDYLKKIAPKNVEITGYLPEKQLIKFHQKAKVYCQLSYQEGEMVGGALGEAMACECVPVVSTKAIALRKTVGDCGFYVPYGDVKATVKAIKKALKSNKGRSARKRMLKFSIKKREEKLIRVINEVLH